MLCSEAQPVQSVPTLYLKLVSLVSDVSSPSVVPSHVVQVSCRAGSSAAN